MTDQPTTAIAWPKTREEYDTAIFYIRDPDSGCPIVGSYDDTCATQCPFNGMAGRIDCTKVTREELEAAFNARPEVAQFVTPTHEEIPCAAFDTAELLVTTCEACAAKDARIAAVKRVLHDAVPLAEISGGEIVYRCRGCGRKSTGDEKHWDGCIIVDALAALEGGE